ncbi:hypothetical protein LINGRAHAP2_LOCUS25619 [Linum grandiflorum]
MGTKLDLTFPVNSSCTGRELKELLRSEFDLPLAKQTLFILPAAASGAATPFHDDSSLADHGIADGGTADMRLEVTVRPEVPITVNLVATKQYPRWKQSFLCFETTTVWELKRMLAERVEWRDGNMGELDLTDRVDSWAMHDNGRITADYLVTDGTDVEVCFLHRIIANGFPHDYTDDEGETEEED